jgi:hypothetical protein
MRQRCFYRTAQQLMRLWAGAALRHGDLVVARRWLLRVAELRSDEPFKYHRNDWRAGRLPLRAGLR